MCSARAPPTDRVSRLMARGASGDSPFGTASSSPVLGTPKAGLLAAVGQPTQAEQLLARMRADGGDSSREKASSTLL